MKLLKLFIIIFISLTTPIKADLYKNLINQLEEGGKLIFIRQKWSQKFFLCTFDNVMVKLCLHLFESNNERKSCGTIL